VVCESDKTAAAGYSEGKYYNLVFPSFSEDEMKLKLVDIIKNTSEETTLLVFRGNTAPEGFNYTRCQQVNIISGEVFGYAVPKDAVRQKDNIKGVYILTGDIVRFRKIDIISEDGEYYIVRIPKASELVSDKKEDDEASSDKVKYLALYDRIIIGGKELFDGKIVG
jgi:signal peptidase I